MTEMREAQKDPMDELEMVFTEILRRPVTTASGMNLSGIEPATDPMAELEEMDEEDLGMAPSKEMLALRTSIEDMKTHLATAVARADKLDRDLDKVCRLTTSARINIQTALAIIHLRRHDPCALSSNSEPGIFDALTSAVADLDKAEADADRIPF